MTLQKLLRLGSRASPLARAQTAAVQTALAAQGMGAEIQTLSTRGDRDLQTPLPELGDKGLFTAELQAALLGGDLDAAVHSAKDLSAVDDPALPLVAVLPRAARSDCLISAKAASLADLPQGARVGTSSLRRAAQLRAARPDLIAVPVRGNVQTRLAVWRAGDLDALILATAGLERLGLLNRLPQRILTWDTAPAQGIIAIQARTLAPPWQAINHPSTQRDLWVERALVRGLGASCRLPVSCATWQDRAYHARVTAWSADGGYKTQACQAPLSASLATLIGQAEQTGRRLAARLPASFWQS